MYDSALWAALAAQLLKLTLALSLGLLVANLIEALHWTEAVAKVASPLIRLSRLKDISGASFAMAFFSGAAANTMLAEAYEKGQLSRQELMLSNLFNSMPTYVLHLPNMFFLATPFIGFGPSLTYVGLSFLSAVLRSFFIVAVGRMTLAPHDGGCVPCRLKEQGRPTWEEAMRKTWVRFRRRIGRILFVSLPIYVVIFFLNRHGAFKAAENFLTQHLSFFSWLPPKAMSVVVFQIASELSAGLAAAGALLQGGGLAPKTIVLALLVGNILSSPMRAFRHQLPFYAGIFPTALAMRLIAYSQGLRAASLAVVTLLYGVFG